MRLKRNGAPVHPKPYLASQASRRSDARKRWSHARERLKNQEIRDFVHEKPRIGWTPEIIAGRIGMHIDGTKTNYESIYLYIYKEQKRLVKYLPQGHKRRKTRRTGKSRRVCDIPDRKFIDERPAVINERIRVDDREADTIASRQSKAALVVLRERKLQIALIAKVERITAEEVKNSIVNLLRKFPGSCRKSITYDNGKEFAAHAKISQSLNVESYFCHPYHSREKGSVENTNGLIRRFFPKKTNFDLISTKDIKSVEKLLNNQPRKSLGFFNTE
ncbi:MAG: IS30 family transposase [Leptospiraceae bacterium]|nr:IS30 family transposase [Leptospiraceae bacterium]